MLFRKVYKGSELCSNWTIISTQKIKWGLLLVLSFTYTNQEEKIRCKNILEAPSKRGTLEWTKIIDSTSIEIVE